MSTISDLFYGSKQNLLDNYLLRRDDTPNSISPTFTIVLNLQFPKISSGVYLIKAQMGNRQIGDYFELRAKKQSIIQLCFTSVSLQFIDEHTSIKLQVTYKSTKLQGYIPMQVAKDMLKKMLPGSKMNKQMNIMMKGLGNSRKFIQKLGCNMVMQSHGQRVLESGFIDNQTSGHRSNSKMDEYSDYMIHNYRSSSHDKTVYNDRSTVERRGMGERQRQIEIKPIEIVIRDIVLKKEVQKDLCLQFEGTHYSINDQFTVHKYSKKGIDVNILYDTHEIGKVHFNSILLFSKELSGQFPIINEHQHCIGVIIINNSPNLSLTTPYTSPHQQHTLTQSITQSTKQTNEQSYVVLHHSTIYFIKQQSSQQQPTLLIRAGSSVTSHSIIQAHHPVVQQLVRLTLPSSILIHTQQQQYIELQVYMANDMVGYCKINIKGTQPLQYTHAFVNMTTNSFICNGLIQLVLMRVQTNYILPESMSRICQIVCDEGTLGMERQMMIGWMMDKHKLIYVESSRVNELMSKARIGIVELCECKYTSVQLYSQLIYMDNIKKGSLELSTIKQIQAYYQLTDLSQFTHNNQVLYLFVLAGNTSTLIHKDHIHPIYDQNNQNNHDTHTTKHDKHSQLKVSQQVMVRRVVCEDMHKLMEGSIPSIKLSISHKVQHRCANPTFNINKPVREGDTIIFYHHSIKQDKDIQLCKIEYQLNRQVWKVGSSTIHIIN